ncbi:O-antigen ligase family protein [Neobacillus mesonae]|uniref:Polysaccharide polymerase n=1 Tax=Neobacillus mesonae TaxID=1193713 RepID=A0A3T0HVD3_9BACI|nr:O-antigen ligase family protein [Neobacillus mesonae]AZU61065.1 hypothetical protein CHR53_07255 [Neobacillus mesonae]
MRRAKIVNKANFRGSGVIWTLILFVYCINFLNIGVYVPLLLSPLVILYLLKKRHNKTFLLTIFILFGFFIVYSLFLYFYGYSSIVSIAGKIIYPTMFFIIGHILVKGDQDFRKTYRNIFAIVLAFTVYGVISTKKAISLYGDAETARSSIGRVGIDMWTNNVVSATALNASLAFGLSLAVILLIRDKSFVKWKTVKYISLLCFLASTYAVIQLGNRTGIIIIFLTLFITIFFTKRVSTKKLMNAIIAGVVLVIASFLYNINLFGIKTSIESSYLFFRFRGSTIEEDPRVSAWKATFSGLFEHPMGGKETYTPLNSAHNLWLDVGYEAGVIPFILLVAFTVISLIAIWRFRNMDFPVMLKAIMLALYVSFMATFFVEPVLIGLNEYFTIFCLFIGMIQRLIFERVSSRKALQLKVNY